jgi:hypothetical protein
MFSQLSDFSPLPVVIRLQNTVHWNPALAFPDNLDVGTGRYQVIAADH